MSVTSGTTLAQFEILAKIGAGGMGEVYRAVDTKLGREVAFKVLPEAMASDPERLSRFQREAKIVASLNHPNIVTLFSVDEAHGIHFLTMELVPGQPLTRLLSPEGFALDRLFDLAIPIADAVAKAHSCGIVHRDLKPENVMVDERGHVTVLDFGLAKMDTSLAKTGVLETMPLTEDGRVMGTLPYMSPEQVQGRLVDARSDVFSLGVMLYEMAAGQRPFLGASSAELMAAIQRDEAVPLETVRSDLPPHLSQIVHQCLQKGPALRFQSAQEVFDELTALKREVVSVAFASGTRTGGTRSGATRSGGTRSRVWSTVQAESADRTKPRWAAALGVLAALAVVLAIALGVGWPRSETHPETASNGTPLTRSIAVLPFENRSGDAANEYFSDGLSEELLNRLAQVPGLRVAARTSSFFFKGHSGEISEIGRRLNVSVILEGSVRKAGNRIKVAASLVDVAEGYQLWAHTYDRELNDVFALQEEIATTVVDALKITLIGESAARLAERSTDNVAAYDAYLLGRHRLVSRNSTDLEEAVAYFEEAARLDPGFAQAHIGRAMTLAMLGFYALRPPEDFMAEAGLSARRALALDSQLGEAHAVLGYLQHRLGRDVEAEPAFERALELNPSFVYTYLWRGSNLGRLGRLEESIELLQKGLRIDPLDPTLHTYVGWSLSLLGRWDEALAALRRATEISPDHATALTLRGWIHALDGRFDLAVRQFRQAIKADGGAVLALSGLVWAYVALDELDQADQWIGHFSTLAPGNPWLANSKLLLHWARGEPGPMLEAARDTLASPVVDTYLALALRELAQADHQAERPADGLDRYRGRHPGLFEEPPQLDLRWQYDSALASAVDLAALLRATGDRSAGDRLLAHCLLTLQADPRPISPLRVFNPLAETTLHAVRGDKAAALSALRAAIDRGPLLEGESSGGWRGNPRALRLHPHLQILQDEPEFQAIVAEVEADLVRMRQALEQDDATASGR